MSSAERRRQVLDVGLEVFGRHGYHQTSMSALAAEAGVTKPVLSQHFASKPDLFAEVLAEPGDRLMRAIEASEVEETPRRRVEAGFRSFFRFFEEQPAAFDVLYGTSVAVDPDFRKDARRVRDTFAEYLTGLIRTVDHGSALAMAAGINGLSEGMIRHWMHGDDPRSAEEMAALAARLAWGGLESLT